jgi:hypothetical protein
MNLSQTPFASGVRYGVSTSLTLPATAVKCVAYFLSRSRIKYFGPFPHGVTSRSYCAVHLSVGYFVTPVCIIRRVFSSITTKIYHLRNSQSFTTVKSHTQQGNRILIARGEDFEEVIFFQCGLELFGTDATFGSFLLFE